MKDAQYRSKLANELMMYHMKVSGVGAQMGYLVLGYLIYQNCVIMKCLDLIGLLGSDY